MVLDSFRTMGGLKRNQVLKHNNDPGELATNINW